MFVEAFNATIQHFKLSAKALSIESGVGESTISHFRNGSIDIKLRTLIAIINGLPPEARKYFLFKTLMPELTQDDIGTLLILIAGEIRQVPDNSNHLQEVILKPKKSAAKELVVV